MVQSFWKLAALETATMERRIIAKNKNNCEEADGRKLFGAQPSLDWRKFFLFYSTSFLCNVELMISINNGLEFILLIQIIKDFFKIYIK